MYRRKAPRPPDPVSVSEARQIFADLVNRAAFGNERITVVRHGRAVVAIVPISDVHRLQAIDAEAILAAGEGTTAAPARTPGRPTRTPRP